jgi:hypothetical protein
MGGYTTKSTMSINMFNPTKRIIWGVTIDYLWKELKLYLTSIEMKASYIMEF